MINIDVIFQDPLILFNKIVPDLLPIIKEYYRTFPEFIIGPYSAEYENYRSVKKNDFENHSFVESLSIFYKENKGFPALENCNGNRLYCLDGVLSLNYWSLRLTFEYSTVPVSILGGNIYSFMTVLFHANELIKHIALIHACNTVDHINGDIAIKLFKYDN